MPSRCFLFLAALCLACSDPAPLSDGGRDAPELPIADAGAPLDPAVFDCTATAPPERASPVPVTCPTDGTCAMRMASSHRGAGAPSVLAPENTLSAIRASIALGADLVELDVRPTSDGALVLMHDSDVSRTTTGVGLVEEMTLAQVQALTIRSSDFAGDFSCERVPTFVEALALAAGRVTLVVDASKTERNDLIVATIREAGALDRVVYDELDPDETAAAIALEPTLRVLVRATNEADLDMLLTRFAAHPPVYVHIEDTRPAVLAGAVHARGMRVFALAFASDIIAPIRPGAYGALYDEGADMLQSNRPDLLGAFLGRR